jgi:hypothetical protein
LPRANRSKHSGHNRYIYRIIHDETGGGHARKLYVFPFKRECKFVDGARRPDMAMRWANTSSQRYELDGMIKAGLQQEHKKQSRKPFSKSLGGAPGITAAGTARTAGLSTVKAASGFEVEED